MQYPLELILQKISSPFNPFDVEQNTASAVSHLLLRRSLLIQPSRPGSSFDLVLVIPQKGPRNEATPFESNCFLGLLMFSSFHDQTVAVRFACVLGGIRNSHPPPKGFIYISSNFISDREQVKAFPFQRHSFSFKCFPASISAGSK